MAAKSITESSINTNRIADKRTEVKQGFDSAIVESLERQKKLELEEQQRKAVQEIESKGNSGRVSQIAGRLSNRVPSVKAAKTVIKFAKAARRIWQLWFAITLIPVCCCCFSIIFGMLIVKRTLDNPFANITTIIKATTCAVSSDPECVVKVFFEKTTDHLTDAMNED